MRTPGSIFCLLSIGISLLNPLASRASQADTPASSAPKPLDLVLPKEAGAILALAGPLNGLGSPELKPWHVRASYETFDRLGKSAGHGTFEVFWAGPKLYRQTFTSPTLTQTEYVTEKGTYRAGMPMAAPYPEAFIVQQLLHPMPGNEDIDQVQPERRVQNFGNLKLECVMLSQKILGLVNAPLGLFPTYCFGPGQPALRFSTYGDGVEVMFNQFIPFQGRYFARQIDVKDKLLPAVSIHVDEVNLLTSVDQTSFVPPAGTVATNDTPAAVPFGVMQGKLLVQPRPQYPQVARDSHVTGTVVLEAAIGRDGRIYRLKILKSPDPNLTIAALVAVRQWEYSPYLMGGEPVEVLTTINVIFSMGRS